jgi:ketosteroid isomerase-like protein
MHLKTTLIVVIIVTGSILGVAQGQSRQTKKDTDAIRAVLDAQRGAWNRGDIDGYMEGYARSDTTVFISGDSVTRGWQTVRDRYRTGYDSREKMGTLTFSDLEVSLLNSTTAIVIGHWQLQRANDEPKGRFTLIFKRLKNGWRIVHDHTSSA